MHRKQVCLIYHDMINKIEYDVENEKYTQLQMDRNGHKCTKYKMCLSIMMFICIKQHWYWVKTIVAFQKSV